MDNKILVVFKKFQDEITALFPLEPGTNNPYDMTCYCRIGQHSAADMLFARGGKLVSPAEYRGLARELRQIGYKLKIGKRIPRNALEVRRKKLAELGKS
jgi:hypothetical protein